MYASWAVPARAYRTRPEDWRSDLEHTTSQNPHRPILRLTVLLFFNGPTVRGPMLLTTPVKDACYITALYLLAGYYISVYKATADR